MGAVTVHVLDGQGRDLSLGEVRQQVAAQPPAVVDPRALGQLGRASREPLARELVEGRLAPRLLDDWLGVGRPPDTAPNVGEQVLQLDLGLPARPAVLVPPSVTYSRLP